MGKPILQPFNGPFQLFQASRSMRSSQGNQTQNQSYPHWILRTSCLLYTQCHMWINCSSLIWIKIKGMISRAQKYHSSEGGQWQCSNLVLNLPMFKASQRFWNWLWIPRRLKREYIFAIGQFPLAKLPASYIYICIYIYIYIYLYVIYVYLGVFCLARPKRRTQNICSGTRFPNAGVFLVDLWIPEASESFFCSLQKGSAVSHNIFQKMFKVFLDPC